MVWVWSEPRSSLSPCLPLGLSFNYEWDLESCFKSSSSAFFASVCFDILQVLVWGSSWSMLGCNPVALRCSEKVSSSNSLWIFYRFLSPLISAVTICKLRTEGMLSTTGLSLILAEYKLSRSSWTYYFLGSIDWTAIKWKLGARSLIGASTFMLLELLIFAFGLSFLECGAYLVL